MGRKAANMRRRPDGTWELRFSMNGKRYSVYGKSQKECRASELQRRKEIAGNTYIRNNALTLDAYFEEWAAHKKGTVAESTLGNYLRMYRRHIRPVMGQRRIKDIERREVVRFQSGIHKRLATGTVRLIMTTLHQILASAVMDEIIARNVCDTVPGVKAKATEKPARDGIHRGLTEEELGIFFKYAAASWHCGAFRLLLLTGMRIGECCALQWRDIDWEKGVIHITRSTTVGVDGRVKMGHTTKTKKSVRDIPINEDIAAVLHRQRALYRDLHGEAVPFINAPVFTTEKGKGIFPYSVESSLYRIQKRAEKNGEGIPHFSVHAFRDTFASMAGKRGVPMNVLKELLGHASLAMTSDLYCHVYEEQKRDAMKTLHIISM